MRMLLKAEVPVDVGNAKAKDGSLGGDIQRILEAQKPEAAYFLMQNGVRTALIFLDLSGEDALSRMVEPWLIAFNADVTLNPAMVGADLERGSAGIDDAAKNFG